MIVIFRVSLKWGHGWRPEGKSLVRLRDGDTVRLCCSANTEVVEVKSADTGRRATRIGGR